MVGIATDGRIASLHERPTPAVYLPSSRMPWGETILIVQTKTDPAPILKETRPGGVRDQRPAHLPSLHPAHADENGHPRRLGADGPGRGSSPSPACCWRSSDSTARSPTPPSSGTASSACVCPWERNPGRSPPWFSAGQPCCGLTGVPCGTGLFVLTYRQLGADLTHGRPLDPLAPLVQRGVLTMAVVLAGAALPAMRAARLDPVEVLRAE